MKQCGDVESAWQQRCNTARRPLLAILASCGVLGGSWDDIAICALCVFLALLMTNNHSMEICWTLFCTDALPVHTLAQVSILPSFGALEAPTELPSRSKTLARRSKRLPRGSKTLPRRSKTALRRSKPLQDAPKTSQDAPRHPKTFQDTPKTPPRRDFGGFGEAKPKQVGTKIVS